ncbi:hypothetical protein [Halomarina oriensis]|uniref:Uncharacterized protein n=1 Tax=Halomarina oriensis TaxID=671145 RepID=A0A6B0GQL6_9EURY|nr:hypothetical protein [Halomarina oriensis]MWG33958.1 hypothetical protein [Halomarina oriensis]
MKNPETPVGRRTVLKGIGASALLATGGATLSGTAAAQSTDRSAMFTFTDDCTGVDVTLGGYDGRYTLEVLLENGNTTTRSKQAPAGTSRSFSFARSIVKARVLVDDTVVGSAVCPSATIQFTDDCTGVDVTLGGYDGRYTLEVLLENGNTTTRSKQAPAGTSRSFSFARSVVKARVSLYGVVVGSAVCPAADIQFSEDCTGVDVAIDGYSGRYTLAVEFENGNTTTRSKQAPAGTSRSFSFARQVATARVVVAGVVVGSATCEPTDDDPGSATIAFTDDCTGVDVTREEADGEFTLEVLLDTGNTTTRTKAAPAGETRSFTFARGIVKARVRVDGEIVASAICPTPTLTFSEDCTGVTVEIDGYSGWFVLEAELANGNTKTRMKKLPEDGSRSFTFARAMTKARVKVQGVVLGSATCMPAAETTYYQVDFVGGTPEELLGETRDDFYSPQGRLVRYLHGSTEEPMMRQSTPPSLSAALADCVTVDEMTVDDMAGTATVAFTVADGCEEELSLASYQKDGPGFDPTELQTLFDGETDTYGPGEYEITVQLPGY